MPWERNAFSFGSFKVREPEFLLSQWEAAFRVPIMRQVFYTSLLREYLDRVEVFFPTGHLWGLRYESHKCNLIAIDTQSPSDCGS